VILLDANIFLRYLVDPDAPANEQRQQKATDLFNAIERGEIQATTTEAVLAEVCFVLASKRQYGVPSGEIAEILSPILRLRGLRLPRGHKRLYTRALELWSTHPKLGFVDALTTALVEDSDIELATFDRDFDEFQHIKRWIPT
jgi:predicted nucleic acid-binding protein